MRNEPSSGGASCSFVWASDIFSQRLVVPRSAARFNRDFTEVVVEGVTSVHLDAEFRVNFSLSSNVDAIGILLNLFNLVCQFVDDKIRTAVIGGMQCRRDNR